MVGTRSWDDVVIGAGASGCVVASRLATSGRRVLLIEAGRDIQDETNAPSLGTIPSSDDWGLAAAPGRGRHPLWIPQGRVVGGTSTIQGGIALVAPDPDYALWEARAGWSKGEIRNALASITFDRDLEEGEHPEGMVPIERARHEDLQPIHEAFIKACLAAGHQWCDDLNGPGGQGVGCVPLAHSNGARAHARNIIIAAARRLPTLTLLPNSIVRSLKSKHGRVHAVEISSSFYGEETISAERFIVAAGALGTPALLLENGMGPSEILKESGIPVIQNLQVGRSLRDHPSIQFDLVLDQGHGIAGRPWFQTLLRDVCPSGRLYQIEIYHDFVLAPSSYAYRRAILSCTLLDAHGKGWVLPRHSSDERAKFRLAFDDTSDRQAMQEVLCNAYALAEHHALRSLGSATVRPHVLGSSRSRLIKRGMPIEKFVSSGVETISSCVASAYHFHGTCPMGPDPQTSVVDASFRVFGQSNLFIADLSVAPLQLRANTYLTALAIGEMCARSLMNVTTPSLHLVGADQ